MFSYLCVCVYRIRIKTIRSLVNKHYLNIFIRKHVNIYFIIFFFFCFFLIQIDGQRGVNRFCTHKLPLNNKRKCTYIMYTYGYDPFFVRINIGDCCEEKRTIWNIRVLYFGTYGRSRFRSKLTQNLIYNMKCNSRQRSTFVTFTKMKIIS